MKDDNRVESAVEMLHTMADAIRAVSKIPNCRVSSVRYSYDYDADACDPDWKQCKDVYAKIPFRIWLEPKYSHDEDVLFKVGDVQMRYKGGFTNPLQIEVDGKWHTLICAAIKAPFTVKFICKKV